jgi:hypothetical protein
MDAYLFSTDHADSYAPYLFVPGQNSPRPGHPDGKSWVPRKAVRLDKAIMDNDPETVAMALETDRHFIAL